MKELSIDRQRTLQNTLHSWITLQDAITLLDDEHEVRFMMAHEAKTKRRLRVLNRLYSRFCVLRRERELRELAEGKLPT